MKLSKKLLLGLGSIGSVAAPISAVIACNNSAKTSTTDNGTDDKDDKTGGGEDSDAKFSTISEAKAYFEGTKFTITIPMTIEAVTTPLAFSNENIQGRFTKAKESYGKKYTTGYWNVIEGNAKILVVPELPDGMTITFTIAELKPSETGVVKLAITMDGKTETAEIAISIKEEAKITQDDLDKSNAMKVFFEEQVTMFNDAMKNKPDAEFYFAKETNAKGTTYDKFYIGENETEIKENTKKAIIAGGFVPYIENVTEMAVDDVVTKDKDGRIKIGSTKKSTRMQVGFYDKTAKKYKLFSNLDVSYDTKEEAADAYIADMTIDAAGTKSATKVVFRDWMTDHKDQWLLLQYWAQQYKVPASNYTEITDFYNSGNVGISEELEKLINRDEINLMVDKFVPGGVDGSTHEATQTGVLFESGSMALGSGSYWSSLKTAAIGKKNNSTNDGFVDDDVHAIGSYLMPYGLMHKSKATVPNGLSAKGEWMFSVDAWAYLTTSTEESNNKFVGIMLIKMNDKWYFATDLAKHLVTKAGGTLTFMEDTYWADDAKYKEIVSGFEADYKKAYDYIISSLSEQTLI